MQAILILVKEFQTRCNSVWAAYQTRYKTIFFKRSAQCLVFEGVPKDQKSKVGAFLVLKYGFGGPQKSEKY